MGKKKKKKLHEGLTKGSQKCDIINICRSWCVTDAIFKPKALGLHMDSHLSTRDLLLHPVCHKIRLNRFLGHFLMQLGFGKVKFSLEDEWQL